jgi:hypothetical protein
MLDNFTGRKSHKTWLFLGNNLKLLLKGTVAPDKIGLTVVWLAAIGLSNSNRVPLVSLCSTCQREKV